MKVGDLVKISCTCGESHDEDPLIGVVVNTDDKSEMVQILLNGRRRWMTTEGIEGVTP